MDSLPGCNLYGDEPMLLKSVVQDLSSDRDPPLRTTLEALPGHFAEKLAEGSLPRTLGTALRKREDVRFVDGDGELRVIRGGTEQRAVRWRVVREQK